MSSPIISVRNIGKKYRLGFTHRHKTLRDGITYGVRLIAQGVKGISDFRRATSMTAPPQEFWALRDISFDVAEGDIIGIIGRNGAGKSTLLKILSQITEPTEGEIRIKGRLASLLEVGTGFHSELSGRENVFMNGAILGMTRTEINAKFDEIVNFAGVEKFIDTPIKRYSSGMQVRLAFAVAAHLEPEILAVDEVLAVGDMEFQKKCIGQMGTVASKGRTVLFVSHNMGIISRLCTSGILLESGRISEIGEIGSVVRKYLSMPVESGNVDLNSVVQRSGDGSARFTRAVTRNGTGRIQDTFTIGEHIVFELHISGGSWIQSGKISLQITSAQGIPVYHLVGEDAGFELSNMGDKGVVTATLKEQKLYPGVYYVDLWLADRSYHPIDDIGNAFKFSVIEGGAFVIRGLDRNAAVVHEVPEWRILH